MQIVLREIHKKKWFYPVLWALVLHLLLIVVSIFIRLTSFQDFPEKTKMSFYLKNVDAKSAPFRQKGARGAQASSKMAVLSGDKTKEVTKTLSGAPLRSLLENKAPVKETKEEVLEENKDFESSRVEQELDQILLETDEREMHERVQVQQKSISQFQQKKAVESASAASRTGANLLKTLQESFGQIRLYSPENVAIDPAEGMPGFTPSSGDGAGSGPSGFELGQGFGESKGEIVRYESLDDFLDIEVYTYEEPATAQKYFMIKIFAKKGARVFQAVPKEILFAVDASLSISPERLEEFKKGIRYCLSNLNKEDLFNIMAFKDETIFFSKNSVPATPVSIKAAERFVGSLTASERTDVYSAFDKIVKLPLSRTPSNVVLISDGRPTYGVVDSRELINSVTRINGRARPIFAFSGGAKVNRYLLDFISYQNRAWSEFTPKTINIDKGLTELYDKIRDPLFLNLRYRLNSLNENEVFPKSLPDFYRNAEFTLFGVYDDEDSFSMQLLGDVDQKTKELIFTRSLKESKRGTADIMKGYAFNKIYYLINRLTIDGPNAKISKEIEDLSRRYGITTPYSPELAKSD